MADKITAQDLVEFNEIIKQFKALNVEISKSVTTMNALSKEFVEINKESKEYTTSTEKLTAAKTKAKNTTQQLTETEKQLIANEKLQQKITEQAAGSYAQLSNQLLLLKNKYKQMGEEQRKVGGKQMLADINKLDKQVKDFDKSLGVHNRNVGNYGETLKGVGSKFIGFLAIFGGAAAILGAFKKLITSTGDGADAYEEAIFKAETATNFFLKSLSTGDMTNFTDRLKDVVKAAGDYFEIMDKLEDKNRSLSVQESKQRIEIARLLTISRDATKSDEEKRDALIEVEKIEKSLAKTRVTLSKTALEAELKLKSKITGLTEDQLVQFVQEYDSVENLIDAGIKYNETLEERNDIIAKGSRGMIRGKDKEAVIALNEELKKMGPYAEAAGKLATKFGNQTKEEYDKLGEALKQFYGSWASEDENLMKVSARRSAFEQTILDKQAKDREAYLNHLRNLQKLYNEDIAAFGEESAKEADKLLEESLTSEQEVIDKKLKADADLNDKKLDNAIKRGEKEIEWEKRVAEETANAKTELAQQSIAALGEFSSMFYDSELEKLNYNKEQEIAAAGDNSVQKEKIEKDYQKKANDIKRKAAITDKITSLFQIALNTATGVTKATAQGLLPLIPYIIAQGAISAALVAARPIPKYAKGVRNFKGGDAEVGEAGYEAIKTPDGNVFLTPDKATRMAIPQGSDIFTHNETKQMLSEGISMSKFDELIKEQKETRKVLSSKPSRNTNITQRGLEVWDEINKSRIVYIDKYFRR